MGAPATIGLYRFLERKALLRTCSANVPEAVLSPFGLVLGAMRLRGFLGLAASGARYARSTLLYFNLVIIVFTVHLRAIYLASSNHLRRVKGILTLLAVVLGIPLGFA